MSNKSSIEWTHSTWNPVTGCTKVSTGCHFCYAERVFPRVYGTERKFTDVRCHPERLDQPLHWKKPRRIFVNSMSDLFHEKVPVRFIAEIFNVMASYRIWCRKKDCDHEEPECFDETRHTYQVLTKRPERMLEILKPGGLLEGDVDQNWPGDCPISMAMENEHWPLPNCWLGVSVEDQKTADERIPPLLKTPAAVRFVSIEPLLGAINLCAVEMPDGDGLGNTLYSYGADCGIDWVIVGGESGPNARPMHPDWARTVLDQCKQARVPFFMKQGSAANWPDFKNFELFPKDLQVRGFPPPKVPRFF